MRFAKRSDNEQNSRNLFNCWNAILEFDLNSIMAVISQQRVAFLFNVRVFSLWIYISSIWFPCSQGTFTVRNYEENEVIFEEELIVLECRAPIEVSNPQFRLLNSQNNVLVDHRYQSFADGHIGYPIEGGVNFQIVITSALIQNRYLCQISEDDNVLTTEEISLNVTPRVSPQCYVNTSTTVTTGDVVGLSCYQEVSALSSNFIFRQILRNGTVNEELPLEYSGLINSFKRKLSSYIRTTATDDGSEFECVITDSGSEKTCTTGEISVQQNQEVTLTITPSRVHSLDRGQVVLFTCESSDSRYMPSWERNNIYQQEDANVMSFGRFLSVTIPNDTGLMNGQVLTFVCTATFEGHSVTEILIATIAFASGPKPTTIVIATTPTTTRQPPQVVLTFSPATVPPLDRGDVVEVQCSPSLPSFLTSWIAVVTANETAAEIDHNGGTLRVSIPTDTTLTNGTVLNFVCIGEFNGITIAQPLAINVIFAPIINRPTTSVPTVVLMTSSRSLIPSNYTPDDVITLHTDDNITPDDRKGSDGENDDGEMGADSTIFIVIAVVVAIVLVATIVIILIAICLTKQPDYSSHEERKFGNAAYDHDSAEEASVTYTSVDKTNRYDPGPDVVPYNDVSRERHVVEIDEEEIYDDSKNWESHEFEV